MAIADHGILRETIAAIDAVLGPDRDAITIARLVVGLFFTGVKLSCGSAGACATPIKTIPDAVCCPSSAMAMPFPGKLRGRRAIDVCDEAFADNGIRRAIGIAVVNALADACWRRQPSPDVTLQENIDAFDAAAPRPGEQVVVVGAFGPFLRQLKRRQIPYLVLEKGRRHAAARRAAVLPPGGAGGRRDALGRPGFDHRHHLAERQPGGASRRAVGHARAWSSSGRPSA